MTGIVHPIKPLTAAQKVDRARKARRPCESLSPPPESDDALGLVFAERAMASLRWSPGLDWMRYDGQVWCRDKALHRLDLAREVAREAAARNTHKADRLASAATRNAIVSMAQADQRLIVPDDQWDRDPLILNTPAGIVDLRTGALRPRTLCDYVTQCTAVAPSHAGDCPRWHRFLREVFPGRDGGGGTRGTGDVALIDFVQRSIGYWLTGDRREQVLHFLHGEGSNGKSVLVDLLQWLMGTYAMKLPASSLMQARGERHPTDLASLRGKRLAVSSELEDGSYLAESLVKELTGDAVLTARFMRQDFFTFEMTHKHVIVGNHKPRLHGGDPAIARRLLLVPFTARFVGLGVDKNLLATLKAEGPAILAWAIRGAALWLADGLQVPGAVAQASAEYLHDHDDLRNWIGECCCRIGEERAKELYGSFALWKKARGEQVPSQTLWGPRLLAVEGIGRRLSNGVTYSGIALTATAKGELNASRNPYR